MKSFTERNPLVVGAVGLALTATVVVSAIEYDKLPFVDSSHTYQAYFAEAGGLNIGAAVNVSGYRVGQVAGVELAGAQVLITFKVDNHIHLGDRTEAAVKTKSLLGAKVLEVTPRGDGQLSAPIPLSHTTPAYQLPDAIGDLSSTISGLDIGKVDDSLRVLAHTFQDTPPQLKAAIDGASRLADTLNNRDANLRNLLANASKVSSVLAERTDQIGTLITQSEALLSQLRTQSAALDTIAGNISALAKQLAGFVADNRQQLRPALDKLNGLLTIVDNRKEQVQKSIKLLNAYAMSFGEALSSGPFFKVYVANLIPGQFLQPFIDAAFSDLGLDPNVLPPSQLTDPQIGQPGTPPLPMPYPRTGQGGQPNLNLPDAITGNPGDPRYPYRDPIPAPPPGGPPPGPPALAPAEPGTLPSPPGPLNVPTSGVPSPAGGAQ
jgi:phospholipid/cholesterol/gamma-HCH transport system substrate-binding protein